MAHVRRGTIFAPVSTADPKHGRWILPLVVLALVAFTYTFVNALPPAEAPTTTVVAAGQGTTTTEPAETTTTTILPPEVVEFIGTADTLAARADELATSAQIINDDYPDAAGYNDTRELLSQLKSETQEFSDGLADVTVPAPAKEKWEDVKISAAAMAKAADDMFDGLVNTSGSEKRLTSLENYNIAAATFAQALDAAKDAATGS